MTQCAECKTCASADKALEAFIREIPFETSHHRAGSAPARCQFGLDGVCCKLCSNGPCRITPKSPRGICGASADAIVARNLLRAVAAGSGCYIHVVENTARNLLETARSGGEIRGPKALSGLAHELGIAEGPDAHATARAVAEKILDDIHKPESVPMELVERLAYEPRFKRWRELGILPGGAKSEVFRAVVKSSTNLNSDPVDMLMNCLKLGISTGLYGLYLTNIMNDVMLGEPEIRPAPVGLGVIDPSFVNVMMIGHQHSLFAHLQNFLASDEAEAMARAAGAKGFRLVGCTCVGQDLQLRGAHCTQVFVGHAGNNYTSEAVLMTGAIDAVIEEFNCALPGIEPICDEMKIKQICIDDVAKKANAEMMPYSFATREADARRIASEAADAYKARRGSVELRLLPDHGNKDTITGVSEVSLKGFLGGTWKPLLDLIVSGDIKGVAGIVGCSSVNPFGHDVLTVELTKELIKRDIIVLSAGCSSGGMENCGLMSPSAADLAGDKLKAVCKKLGIPPVLNFGPCLAIGRLEAVATALARELGIDLPQLPVVLSAPQWLEEQAIADGMFAASLGLPLHLGTPPFVLGSPLAVNVLTEGLKDLTGGRVMIEGDAHKAADALDAIIEEKRRGLKI